MTKEDTELIFNADIAIPSPAQSSDIKSQKPLSQRRLFTNTPADNEPNLITACSFSPRPIVNASGKRFALAFLRLTGGISSAGASLVV